MLAVALCVSSALGQPPPLYLDPNASIADRADDLLSRMTLAEKIAQTWAPYGTLGGTDAIAAAYNGTGVGMLAYKVAGSSDPATMAATRNDVQRVIVEGSRLGIPASFSQEALHSSAVGGVVFPESVTLGATWDVALVEEVSAAIAREARSLGIDVAFAPVINLWSDARFGRLQEGYSEDPSLTAALATAAVRGFQGAGSQPAGGAWGPFAPDRMVALAKHYAA